MVLITAIKVYTINNNTNNYYDNIRRRVETVLLDPEKCAVINLWQYMHIGERRRLNSNAFARVAIVGLGTRGMLDINIS